MRYQNQNNYVNIIWALLLIFLTVYNNLLRASKSAEFFWNENEQKKWNLNQMNWIDQEIVRKYKNTIWNSGKTLLLSILKMETIFTEYNLAWYGQVFVHRTYSKIEGDRSCKAIDGDFYHSELDCFFFSHVPINGKLL